jgi:hypothetical protein
MAHFQSQNCLIKTPTEVKKLEGVSFCPYKFYSSVHLAKLAISITRNLRVTVQDTGHQGSIFFPQAKNVFAINARFKDPSVFLPFNVDLPCRNPFTFLLMAVRPL